MAAEHELFKLTGVNFSFLITCPDETLEKVSEEAQDIWDPWNNHGVGSSQESHGEEIVDVSPELDVSVEIQTGIGAELLEIHVERGP